MKMATVNDPDGRLPASFPLSLASNGQYAKKHRGKRYQFGAASFGWRAALKQWEWDWPHIIQGRTPPPMPAADGSVIDTASWEYVATRFIERESLRSKRGEIDSGSFCDIRNAVEIATTHVGPARQLRAMLPDDWKDLRHALSYNWKRDDEQNRWIKQPTRVGVSCLGRRVVHVRAMLNWAGPDGEKLIPAPTFGDRGFKLVPLSDKKKSMRVRERERGVKRWEVEQVMAIFNALDEQLQAMFLLSLNCGYTAADCAALPWWAVDLAKGIINGFDRVKTGNGRYVTLWPETVAALRHVEALKLKPREGTEKDVIEQPKTDDGLPIGKPIRAEDLVFLTRVGNPWVTRTVKLDDNGHPRKESHKDSVALEFNKVLLKLGIKRYGVGFGTGRHTFESHALRCGDKDLVNAIMGHSTGEMSQWYDHAMEADVRALTDGLRARLLPHTQDAGKDGAAASGGLRLAV
jgi:integrase